MSLFIPQEQAMFAAKLQRCLTGDCPTIADVRAIWGENTATFWLENQIRDLNEYYGSKNKMNTLQIQDLARILVGEFYYIKLAEFMVFFAYLKSGRYGTFYGGVDPLTITIAMQKFKSDRAAWLQRIEENEQMKKVQEKPVHDPEKLTWAEWKEIGWMWNMGFFFDKDGKIM